MNGGGTVVGFVAAGLFVSALAIAGIIRLARRFSRQTEGMKVLFVFAILFLTMVGLGGLAFSGCVATMSNAHF